MMSTMENVTKLNMQLMMRQTCRRPKLLRSHCVRKHHGGGGVENWRKRAKYRENWGRILKKPKPSQGCWAAADDNYDVKILTVTTMGEYWFRWMSITIQFRNILFPVLTELLSLYFWKMYSLYLRAVLCVWYWPLAVSRRATKIFTFSWFLTTLSLYITEETPTTLVAKS